MKKVLISCYACVLVVATVVSAIEIEEVSFLYRQLGRLTIAAEQELYSFYSLLQSIKNWKAPESFKKRFPYYLSGYDNDGAPGKQTSIHWVIRLN